MCCAWCHWALPTVQSDAYSRAKAFLHASRLCTVEPSVVGLFAFADVNVCIRAKLYLSR